MTIEKITLNSQQHERFHFKTKRAEMSIISALLANAVRHTPPHETTQQFRHLCRAMMKCLDKALVLSVNQPPTTQPSHESQS